MNKGLSELSFIIPGAAFITMIVVIIATIISPDMLKTIWTLLVNNNGLTF